MRPPLAVLISCTLAGGLGACASLPSPTPLSLECLSPAAPVRPADSPRYRFESERGDAWITRHDGRVAAPTWRTVLRGTGAESITAVVPTPAGDLLVVGSTTSPSLSGVSGCNSGGRDGFVVRLDGATGRVRAGTLVGTSGDEELTGVVEDRDGRVFAAGLGDADLLSAGRRPMSWTEVSPASEPPRPPGGEVDDRRTFLSRLGRGLDRELGRVVLPGSSVTRPRVWLDCQGQPVVGLPAASTQASCNGNPPNVIYEQDRIGADYASDHIGPGNEPGGWGYHALRWKEHHSNPASPSWTLDWSLATFAIPKDFVQGCADTNTLNLLELQLFKQGGALGDPPGGWQCGNHDNEAQLALRSAFLMKRWGTPVYTQLGNWVDDLGGGGWQWSTRPAGLERVEFQPVCFGNPNAYGGETLESLCNFGQVGVDTVEQLSCAATPFIPGVSGAGFALKLDRLIGAEWNRPSTWWQRPFSWDPDSSFFWQEWYTPGEYVYDPPVGSERQVVLLSEAARQLADLVVRERRIRATRFVAGRRTNSEEFAALVPAGD